MVPSGGRHEQRHIPRPFGRTTRSIAGLRLYLARLADFLAVNAAGTYAPAEAWGKANDDKAEAWAALSYQEKQLVRACAREGT